MPPPIPFISAEGEEGGDRGEWRLLVAVVVEGAAISFRVAAHLIGSWQHMEL